MGVESRREQDEGREARAIEAVGGDNWVNGSKVKCFRVARDLLYDAVWCDERAKLGEGGARR